MNKKNFIDKIKFKGIIFKNFQDKNFKKIIKKKGLFLFPSGPGLSSIEKEIPYLKALKNADYNFFDSGYFVLLLKYFKKIDVNKFSGYLFIKLFLEYIKKNNNKKLFLVDPNIRLSVSNTKLFNKLGVSKKNINNYIAPHYDSKSISDKRLLNIVKNIKPDYILLNIGGGTQEILGLYLKDNINFKCTIMCTGAAISFFTGDQAPINVFFDKIYLGWLIRIIFNPIVFLPRYLKTLKLINIVLNNNIKVMK
jgi:N-acetylglucosaminyldiphosphoundecaprenol N-acetyl-beta-D-mannosaminyltransferase